MNSRDRVLKALKHKEADKVPLDISGFVNSGIHINAYKKLLNYLGIKKNNIKVCDIIQQLACIHEDVLKELKVDVRGIMPKKSWSFKLCYEEEPNGSKIFKDEYGIEWRMPVNGYYFDPYINPLANSSLDDMLKYNFPNPEDKSRLSGLKKKIFNYYDEGFFIFFYFISGGFLEISQWLRGFENFYCDLASNPKYACALMDKLLEIEIKFWDTVLSSEIGDYIQMVFTANDIGGQDGLLISPITYRKYIKPRQEKLNSFIKKKREDLYIYYHSDGAIYEIIPDLIEIGIDVLNPVQVSADNMDIRKLKKEFGNDITFWGASVESQKILPYGSIQEVKEEVKKSIDVLAPGGGYVFAPIHNIQADVPPRNIMAMWEALQEYGKY